MTGSTAFAQWTNHSTTSVQETENGSPQYLHEIALLPGDWAANCVNPVKPLTCSIVFRSTYYLPPTFDQSVGQHAFSLWIGFPEKSGDSQVSLNMEWFNEVVAVEENATQAMANFVTADAVNGIEAGVNIFLTEDCVFRPVNEIFPRGSLSCRFQDNFRGVEKEVGKQANWMNGESLSFSFQIVDRRLDKPDPDVHVMRFSIPVDEVKFATMHKSTILDAHQKNEDRLQALRDSQPSILDSLWDPLDMEPTVDCDSMATERARLACNLGEDESSVVIRESDGSIKGCPQDSSDVNYDFKADMEEAEFCAGATSNTCWAFRADVPAWYGKTAAKFYDCRSPGSGSYFLSMGERLCKASALNQADRGECSYVFGLATNSF